MPHEQNRQKHRDRATPRRAVCVQCLRRARSVRPLGRAARHALEQLLCVGAHPAMRRSLQLCSNTFAFLSRFGGCLSVSMLAQVVINNAYVVLEGMAARPQAFSRPALSRRSLVMPQVHPGSVYRCGRST